MCYTENYFFTADIFEETSIRFIIAIILSLFVHLVIIYLFFINKANIQKPKIKRDDKPINLNLSTFEPSPKKAAPKPKKIVKKPKPKKKIIKKKSVKKKPKPKKVIKEKKVAKKIIKKIITKEELKKPQSFEESLMDSGKPYQAIPKQQNNPMIDRLYGSEFKSYTPKQKNFIKHNLETIHEITQRVLVVNGYPQEALDLFQEGVNVISFYLHPNGSISKLRIKKSSNSYFLDENTKQVIEMAYSQYPLPKVKTKIIFYVNYRIE